MRFILSILFLTQFFTLFAQTGDWKFKVEPSVLLEAESGREVDFLVVLSEQADLSEARFLPKKQDKGKFVFEKLSETAERTQVSVKQTIAAFQAPSQPFWVVNAVWSKGKLALLEALARLPEVQKIQSNPIVHFQEPVDDAASGCLRVPEWGILDINANDVWALGYTGTGVVVGGQDTGYDWDVAALKLKYRGWNNTTMLADHNYNWHDAIHASTGNPCGNNSIEPCDDHNHGTHTMGTMAGSTGSIEIGVAYNAKWMGCRNMDEGDGTPATYLECFEWFLAPTNLSGLLPDVTKAPAVINNSWGCPINEGCNTGNFATMNTAVENLRTAGVVVVVSAGNSGSGCSSVSDPPAIFAGSLSVGATNSDETIATFSSRGPVTVDGSNRLKPNVSAPGVGVYSCIRNGNYAFYSGTSMAGPHVVGAVALMLSANPALAGQVEQIETILETTARDKTSTQNCGSVPGTNIPNNTFGYGIIDALAAVNAALALLPVELTEFAGTPASNGNFLNWHIESGGSLNHFELEHSGSKTAWQVLAKIPFSLQQQTYWLTHERPLSGTNYYRLKMVELDGSVKYSNVIAISWGEEGKISVFPSPAGDKLTIQVAFETSDELKIQIFDAGGSLWLEVEKEIQATDFSFEVNALPSGIYFLKMTDGNGRQWQQRFVKK